MSTQYGEDQSHPDIDKTHGLHLLKEMLRIRRLEEKCAELYTATKIRGFLHLYIGEEAIAVGSMQALRPEDAVVATYREHGHALARGMSMNSVMAEMFGKVDGCSRGRGGSMHLFDADTRFYGGNAIVAGGLPIAIGLALADKMLGRSQVTVCFFGEGAAAEGEFHETLNLADLWQLPVLFCCENNLYAMGTALERSQSQTDIAKKARVYSIPSETVDGMDVIAVEEASNRLASEVRAGKGPRFIEFETYRFRAHSMYDPELYRSKAEVQTWMKRDPIELFSAVLKSMDFLDDEGLVAIESEVQREVDAAVEFAEASTFEPVEDLERFVYSERRST